MRPSKEAREVLEREADLRAQLTSYADLALKTGYSEQYVANYVGRLIRIKREKNNYGIVVSVENRCHVSD